jgi:hypothetical protein
VETTKNLNTYLTLDSLAGDISHPLLLQNNISPNLHDSIILADRPPDPYVPVRVLYRYLS